MKTVNLNSITLKKNGTPVELMGVVHGSDWKVHADVVCNGTAGSYIFGNLDTYNSKECMILIVNPVASAQCAFITLYRFKDFETAANDIAIRTEMEVPTNCNLLLFDYKNIAPNVGEFMYYRYETSELDAYFNNPKAGYRYGYQHDRVKRMYHEKYDKPIKQITVQVNNQATIADGTRIIILLK